MSDSIITSDNMSLPIPVASQSPGPDYALDVNTCLLTIDSHDHSSGSGVKIGPSGINMNADLSFLNNNAIALRSARFQAQSAPLSAAADYKCLNVSGVDLYYLDGNGNSVRITQSGAVAGSPGSIGSLTPPASVTYVSATPAYVFQSDSNIAANLDGGSLVIRKLTASSAGITISAPSALASNYTMTLPAALPGSQLLLQIDNTGQISASNTIPSTITLGAGAATLSSATIAGGAIFTSDSGYVRPGSGAILAQGSSGNTLQINDSVNTTARPIVVSAQPGTNGLMIVRGFVNSAGVAITGEGYSVNKIGTGNYQILYTSNFTDAAVPVVTPDFTASSQFIVQIVSASNSNFIIDIFSRSTGGVNDCGFYFIAIGQRA